jgi:SAM-dependent methyltransferase
MVISSKASLRWLGRNSFAAPLRFALPLSAREWLLRRWGRFGPLNHSFLAKELLKDLAQNDPAGFHRFLWSNHTGGLAYGKTYEISQRFGDRNLRASRRELIADITRHLLDSGVAPERDIDSVFEAGCSLGYLLRFLEEQIFPSATCLRGMDVDQRAIETGSSYLRDMGSKIELVASDISNLERVLGDRKFDVVLCCGVLMYLDEPSAARAVATMLEHTRLLLGLISLADPSGDNSALAHSMVRPGDLAFIHNVDAMVEKARGKVVTRKWTGADPPGRYSDSPPLFLLAQPD